MCGSSYVRMEDKRTPVFPLFIVSIINQTFAFLFALSSAHSVSVTRFFILHLICFFVILPVKVFGSPTFP